MSKESKPKGKAYRNLVSADYVANSITYITGIYHTTIKVNGLWYVTSKYSVEHRNSHV